VRGIPAIEVGRICIKQGGREKGRRCVIVDLMDKNYVLVTGPKDITGVRRRRLNLSHLIPTDEKIDIEHGSTDENVKEALEKPREPSQTKNTSD